MMEFTKPPDAAGGAAAVGAGAVRAAAESVRAAPAEELWATLATRNAGLCAGPAFEAALAKEDEIEVPVQNQRQGAAAADRPGRPWTRRR